LVLLGKAILKDNNFHITVEHNHPGNQANVQLLRFEDTIRTEAQRSRDPPRRIIATILQQVPQFVRPIVRRSNVSRNIRRISNAQNGTHSE